MGLTVAPTTNLMVKAASDRGHAMSDVADALATLTNVAMASGAIVGPMLAGLVVQAGGAYEGFRWLVTVLAFVTAAVAVVVAPVFAASGSSGSGTCYVEPELCSDD